MYYINIKPMNFSHLVFAEILTTNQLIELTEKLLDTKIIDYNAINDGISCVTDNMEYITITVEHINSFSFLDFPQNEEFLKELQETIKAESLEEVINFLVTTH